MQTRHYSTQQIESYLCGEMSPSETQAFEEDLSQDPALRLALHEVQASLDEWAEPPAPTNSAPLIEPGSIESLLRAQGLTEDVRQLLASTEESDLKPTRPLWRNEIFLGLVALAASVFFVFMIVSPFPPSTPDPDGMVSKDQEGPMATRDSAQKVVADWWAAHNDLSQPLYPASAYTQQEMTIFRSLANPTKNLDQSIDSWNELADNQPLSTAAQSEVARLIFASSGGFSREEGLRSLPQSSGRDWFLALHYVEAGKQDVAVRTLRHIYEEGASDFLFLDVLKKILTSLPPVPLF